MSVVDDAKYIAREKCRADGKRFEDLPNADQERLLKEALDELAFRKDADQ